MEAVNFTRGVAIHKDVRVAKTLKEKSEGLLKSGADAALFFKTRWGIHTFGMKFPIDCLVLDGDMKIVALRANVMPGRFFFWNPRYQNVLELPAGTMAHTGTEIGDAIKLLA